MLLFRSYNLTNVVLTRLFYQNIARGANVASEGLCVCIQKNCKLFLDGQSKWLQILQGVTDYAGEFQHLFTEFSRNSAVPAVKYPM